jgi:hypothetical protein
MDKKKTQLEEDYMSLVNKEFHNQLWLDDSIDWTKHHAS